MTHYCMHVGARQFFLWMVQRFHYAEVHLTISSHLSEVQPPITRKKVDTANVSFADTEQLNYTTNFVIFPLHNFFLNLKNASKNI